MNKIESIQTGEKSIGTFYCAGEGFEPGASGVVLQSQNRDITRSPTPAEMCPMVFTAHARVSG